MEAIQFKALIVSVGGSKGPIKYIILQHRVEHVWFFCSSKTHELAEEIIKDIEVHHNYRPNYAFIDIEDFEDLGECYLLLRKKIPELLAQYRINPEQVLVDYTGGTKSMSAALVLAGIEKFKNFSYVGGERRNKNGTGVVIDGEEKWIYQLNPWTQLGIREVERAISLWENYLFDAAATILFDAAKFVPQKKKFEAIATVAQGMAAKHRFDFRRAIKALGRARDDLKLLFDGKDDYGLLNFVETTFELLKECNLENKLIMLNELLDNCIRCAKQHHFEDAAATLYRAIELQVQIWLEETTDGAFKLGKLRKGYSLPEKLRDKDYIKCKQNGEIKLGLEDCIRALWDLGDKRVYNIFPQLKKGSNFRNATEKRNAGIRAHGLTPINQDDFNLMKRVASELFGFNLETEKNPIPPMDEQWFM